MADSPWAPRAVLARMAAREDVRMVGQLLLALLALFVLVAGLGFVLRPQLSALGSAFVQRFGLLGMALGTYLADGVQFPIPPQFYMLAAISRGDPPLAPLLWISTASMAAGCTGAFLARRSSSLAFFRDKVDKSRSTVDRLLERYGIWTFVLLSVSPVPYSIVCYCVGIYRMPWRYLGVIVGLRGPRLAIMYWIIRAGWRVAG